MSTRAHAHAYIAAGLRVLPMARDSKRPTLGGFGADAPTFCADADAFRTRDGIAILCGPCPALGATDDDPTAGDWLMCLDLDGGITRKQTAEALGCKLPTTLTTHQGAHLWYRVSPGAERDQLKQWNSLLGARSAYSGEGKAPDVDLKWAGGYARETGAPSAFDVDEISELPRSALKAILAAPGATRERAGGPAIDLPEPTGVDPDKAEALIEALCSEWPEAGGGRHDCSKALGGALRTHGVSRSDAERLAWAVLSGGGCSDNAPLRLRGTLAAWERADRGEPAYGVPKLRETLVGGGKATIAALRALAAPWKPTPWESQAIAEALRVGAAWGAAAASAGLGPERHISSALDPKDIRSAATELRGRRFVTDKALLRQLAAGASDLTRADALPMATALARAFPQHSPDALVGALVDAGLDQRSADTAVAAATAKLDAPKAETPAGRIVALNEETGARRPEHVINAEARTALLALPGLYVRAGVVCEVAGSTIVGVGGGVLRDRLTRACSFARWSEGEGVESYLQYHQAPPDHVVSALDGEHYGSEAGRQLAAVLRAPTLTEAGDVISEPGYDSGSGLYLPGVCVPEDWALLPITEARAALLGLVGDFPYEDPETDRAVALAALLTVAARPLLWRMGEAVPAFLFDAGDGGAGKTLLAHVVRAVAGCSDVTDLTWTDEPEEMGKAINAHIFEGAPIMVLDNVATGRTVRLHALTSYLTATTSVAARRLGKSEKQHVAWLTTLVITGCNVQLADELSRRFLRVRLVNQTGRTYTRTPSELEAYARDGAAVWQSACLALLSEHIRSGRGYEGEGLSSYEGWQALVAGCVAHHFGVDPCVARADQAGLDEEREAIGEALAAVAPHFQKWTVLRDLLKSPSHDLKSALEAVVCAVNPRLYTGEVSTLVVGKALGALKDRPAGGLVVRMNRSKGARKWRIEPV